MTTLRIQPLAEVQADTADDWWRENRPQRPELFADEFESLLRSLVEFPELGRSAPHPKHPAARCRVMPTTRYVLYYDFDAGADHIEVLAVWSSYRGRGPF